MAMLVPGANEIDSGWGAIRKFPMGAVPAGWGLDRRLPTPYFRA